MKRDADKCSEFFAYRGGELHCEGVSLAGLAKRIGTPLYVYSQSALEQQFRQFESAFSDTPHITCYAVKANSNLAILALFRKMGAGFDIVSGGELRRVICAGADPGQIVFSGVGKSADELDLALKHGILQFNVESEPELALLEQRARAAGRVAPVGLRLNPDVDPVTHPYIATGLSRSKFGLPAASAVSLFRQYSQSRHLRILGIGCHIGSQITSLGPFIAAARRLSEVVLELRAAGIRVRHLDLGGGLGIRYDNDIPPSPAVYAAAIKRELGHLDCSLVLEPGRVIVGAAGILLTSVQLIKKAQRRNFVVVDAALNDLIRPSLYGAYHRVLPVSATRRPASKVDVVGPVCESADFLAQDRMLPRVKPGELLAVMSAGAYGFVLSSNYNSRPRAAEILIKDGRFRVIRKREAFADLVRLETAQPFR